MKQNSLSKLICSYSKNNDRAKKMLLLLFFIFSINSVYSQSGSSLNFDGTKDYILINNSIPASADKTYEAWVYPTNLSGFKTILNHTNWTTGTIHFQFLDDKLHFDFNGNNYACNYSFSPDNWYHVAAVYSTDSATISFYVNGNLTNTAPVENTAIVPANQQIELGGWSGDRYFKGAIDQVRIWNRALTATEIKSKMYCELATGETGLVASYNFNQGLADGTNTTENTLTDSSGNNNTGALNNFALTGTSSNWTANQVAKSSSETVNQCGGFYYWSENNTFYYESGTYTHTVDCFTKTLNLNTSGMDLPEIDSQFRLNNATIADITVKYGQNIQWYADATSLDVLPKETILEAKTYYATQSQTAYDTDAICVSERLPVNITLGDTPDGYTFIADARFEQKLIDLEYDDVVDNFVKTSNIDSVIDLNLAGAGIQDLTGIKSFRSLVNLDIIYNSVENLDLSGLTALETLGAYGNYSKTINLTGLSNLKELNVGNSDLSEINLNGLTALEKLQISSDAITNLDLTGLTNLKDLNCRYTKIKGLDLRNKPNLEYMNASQIKTLTCILVDDVAAANAKTYVYDPSEATRLAAKNNTASKKADLPWSRDIQANYSLGSTNTITVSLEACNGYTWSVSGVTYTKAGTYAYTKDCVSEVLELTFTKPTNTIYVNECSSYTWALNDITYTKSGTYLIEDDCAIQELVLSLRAQSLETGSYVLCGPATADDLFVSSSNGIVKFYTTETGSDLVTGTIAEGANTFYVSQTEFEVPAKMSKIKVQSVRCESVRVPIEYIVRPTIDNTIVFENGKLKVATVVSGDTYRWFDVLADADVVGEINSSFTPAFAGSYKVYIRRNSETPGDYCWRVSEVFDTKALSTTGFDDTTELTVYPNPSSDVFFIDSKENGVAVVFDVLGKTIQSQKITSGTNKLDLSNAPNGVYLLKVINDNKQSKTIKLIKK